MRRLTVEFEELTSGGFWLTGSMGVRQAQGSDVAPSGIGGGVPSRDGDRAPCVRRRRRARRAGGRRGRAGRRVGRRSSDGRCVGQAGAQAKRSKSRRSKGAKFAGRVVAESDLRTEPLPRPSGNLEIVRASRITNDRAKVNIYNPDGSYSIDAVEELNFVLRCRRTDAEKAIDIQLLTWLSLIYDHFGGKPLQIVSGYPQPAQADEQPLQGARDGHQDRGRLAQAGPRVRGDARSRRHGHRPLSAEPLRPHRRSLAAQLPLDRQLAAEFERGREAPAPRLEAQEARELALAAPTDPSGVSRGAIG